MEIICDYFTKNAFNKKEIAEKKKKIYLILIDIFKNDKETKNITNIQLKDIFILYDNVFLFDQFYKYLKNNNFILKFNVDSITDTGSLGSTIKNGNNKRCRKGYKARS